MSTKVKTQVTATPTPTAAPSQVGGQSLLDTQETQTDTDDALESDHSPMAAGSGEPPDSQLQRAEQQGHHFEQIEVAAYKSASSVQRLIQRQAIAPVNERWEDGAVSLKPIESTLAEQVSPSDEKWEDGAVTLKADTANSPPAAPSPEFLIQESLIQKEGDGSFAAGSHIENRLKNSRGGGQPLSDSTRDFMESRFDNDFSAVRVHTNAEAVQMNQNLKAQAFTHGNDIYFNSGKYNPESTGGKRLLAHELTHTIQQTGPKTVNPKRLAKKAEKANKQSPDASPTAVDVAVTPKVQRQPISQVESRPVGELEDGSLTVQPQLMVGAVGDRYEQEADRVADHVMQQSPLLSLDSPQPTMQLAVLNEPPETTDVLARYPLTPALSPANPNTLQRGKKKDIKDDVRDAVKGIKEEVASKTTPEAETTEANKSANTGQDLANEADRELGNANSEKKAKKAAKKLKKKAKEKSRKAQEEADQAQESEVKKAATDAQTQEQQALEEAAKQAKETEEAQQRNGSETAETEADTENQGTDGSADAGEDTDMDSGAIALPQHLPDPGPITAPIPKAPKAPPSAAADPAFAAAVEQSQHVAAQQSLHKPAEAKAQEAQDAAQDPAQQSRRAQATQANEAGEKEPKLFDREAFVSALLAVLESNKPKSQGDVEKGKGMDGASEKMTAEIDKAKEGAGGELTESATRAPDVASEDSKAVVPAPSAEVEAGDKPADELIDAAAATPKPKTSEEIEKPLQETQQSLETLIPKSKKDLPPIQTQLMVGAPGDKYEQEADRMADAVLAMPEAKTLTQLPKNNQQTHRYAVPSLAPETPQATAQTQPEATVSEEDADADTVQRQSQFTQLPDIQLLPGLFLQRQAVLEAETLSQDGNAVPLDQRRLETYEKEAGVNATGVLEEGKKHFGGEAQKQFRDGESSKLTETQGTQASSITTKNEEMFAARQTEFTNIQATQAEAQLQDESDRGRVTQEIQTIYDETKGNVNGILTRMDERVNAEFSATDKRAKAVFERRQKQLFKEWKHDYYKVRNPLLIPWIKVKTGWAYVKIKFYLKPFFNTPLWLVNKVFTGLPDEVNQIYEIAKEDYLAVQREGVHRIADIVEEEMNAAKTEVDRGRQRVQEYVAALPEDLRAVGAEAASNIQAQFDSLEQTIQDKQNSLVNDLKAKYEASLKEINDRIEELKAANASLVSKIAKAIADIAKWILRQVLRILEPPLKLIPGIGPKVGKFLDAFVDDPGGIMKTLFKGLGEGFKNFGKNIKKHLINGFFEWLLGSGMPINFPDKFDLEGVLDILLQILGISKDAIFYLASSLLPSWAVELLEMLMEQGISALSGLMETLTDLGVPDYVIGFFKAMGEFPKKGVLALWDFIKSIFSSLKGEFITTIITQLVIPEIVVAGIQWLVGLLNPAAGIVKIAKAIIDVIIFLIDNRALIIQVLEAVGATFSALIDKAWMPVAVAVEFALAKIVPLALGLFISLLGLGGIPKKITKVVEKLRAPVDKGLAKVLEKIGFLLDPVGTIQDGVSGLRDRRRGSNKNNKKDTSDKSGRPSSGTKTSTKNKSQPPDTSSNKKPSTTKDTQTGKTSTTGKKLGTKDNKKKKDKDDQKKTQSDDSKQRLSAAMKTIDKIAEDKRDPTAVKRELPKVKKKYKLDALSLTKRGKDKYRVVGKAKTKTNSKKVGTVRRKPLAGSTAVPTLQPQLEDSIQRATGKGANFTGTARTQMESAFGGANFADVRIHHGAKRNSPAETRRDRLSRALDAQAFTVNQDIVFRQDRYQPGAAHGQRLLAHELSPVQQPRSGYRTGVAQRKKNTNWNDDNNQVTVKKRLKASKSKGGSFTVEAKLMEKDAVLKKVAKTLKRYIKLNARIDVVKKHVTRLKVQYKLKTLKVIPLIPDNSRYQIIGEVKSGKTAQRQAVSGAKPGLLVTPGIEADIQRAAGQGQAIAPAVRAPLENAFGMDFSPVRIHTGQTGDRLSRALDAKAFTTGRDIFFRQGTYTPASASGKHLLAHELTHVVQQSGERPTVMMTRVQRQGADPPPVQRSLLGGTSLWIQRNEDDAASASDAGAGRSAATDSISAGAIAGGVANAAVGMAASSAGTMVANTAVNETASTLAPTGKVKSRLTNENSKLTMNVKVKSRDLDLFGKKKTGLDEDEEPDEAGIPPSIVNDIVRVIQDIVNQNPDPDIVSRKLNKVRVMFEMNVVKLVSYGEVGETFEYVIKINGRAKFLRASKIANFLKRLGSGRRKANAPREDDLDSPSRSQETQLATSERQSSKKSERSSPSSQPSRKRQSSQGTAPEKTRAEPATTDIETQKTTGETDDSKETSTEKVKPLSTAQSGKSKAKLNQAQDREIKVQAKVRRIDAETVNVIIRAVPQTETR